MKIKNILFALCFLLFIFLQACDEFLLKKSVAVEYLNGDITFEPSGPALSGTLGYDIRNNQLNSLNEIFFISHSLVSVDSIVYENETIHFEQGVGYGFGIYRIKVPSLQKGAKARIVLKFHIDGPVEEDRFLLTKNNVFIDAEKIWLPVPFAQAPNFLYSIRVRTPLDFHSVLGAKTVEETTNGGKRSVLWQSESEDVVMTGNLFISRFQRLKRGPLSLYSFKNENADAIFRYANLTLRAFETNVGQYPFSQVQIVNELFQYKDMEEFIDGEATANIVQISPDIVTNSLLGEREIATSLYPDIPRNSTWKLFEALSHELSHAYIRGIIKFEDESLIESEALSEFMGLKVISLTNGMIYDKFIDRNRIEIMNLFLTGGGKSKLLKYLYGVNCLNTAFSCDPEVFFRFIKTLIEKYGYTRIQAEQLVTTAQEMNFALTNGGPVDDDVLTNRMIDTEALRLWTEYSLCNLKLSVSNIWITNYLTKKRYAVEEKTLLTVNNDFPVDITVTLYENYKNHSATNLFRVEKDSETGVIVEKNLLNASINSKYGCLEQNLADNSVKIPVNGKKELYRNIADFYKNQGKQKADPQSGDWKALENDRKKTLAVRQNVSFLFDRMRENGDQFVLEAYKVLDNKPFSYVIFRGKKIGQAYYVNSVVDPVLQN